MAIAEIITIGTELLLGEIQDTNSKYIARVLRDIGVDLYRLSTVGDNQGRITATILEALSRAEIVITTGGLGPTVDDPTRQAVADAADLLLKYHPELWDSICKRFERFNRTPTENNKRQAFIPEGAIVIENDVGTAPAFVIELGHKCIISLPGVPREMEYLIQTKVLDYLKNRYALQSTIIKAKVIHTVSKGESAIDEVIGELEKLSNPTVGLLAHPGQTDIRVTAKAPSAIEAETMIEPIVEILYEKLADVIYGIDDETLEMVVSKLIKENNLHLAVVECGLEGQILRNLNRYIPELVRGESLDPLISIDTIKALMDEFWKQQTFDLVLGVRIKSAGEALQECHISLISPDGIEEINRLYDGPPDNAQIWAMNASLDMIRRKLLGYS